MRFRFMRFSIYAVLGIGPYSCFTQQYSHIMRFLVKIIVHKILVIFILHLCYSCITRFFLGNKKRINRELSVPYFDIIFLSSISFQNTHFHNEDPVFYHVYVVLITQHTFIRNNGPLIFYPGGIWVLCYLPITAKIFKMDLIEFF